MVNEFTLPVSLDRKFFARGMRQLVLNEELQEFDVVLTDSVDEGRPALVVNVPDRSFKSEYHALVW